MHKFIVPALAALSLATPAFAEPAKPAETVSVEVQVEDLDLSQPAGIAALESRVDKAIESICGRDSAPLYKFVARRQCERSAQASADEQIARLGPDTRTIALNR